ncbi:MAG: transglycosylase domain-containing protein [Candidatus Absconditabacterales bacterium]|nr:transglycosylase domain-containing protein [Candidatus Absconditabacterales bacterium]
MIHTIISSLRILYIRYRQYMLVGSVLLRFSIPLQLQGPVPTPGILDSSGGRLGEKKTQDQPRYLPLTTVPSDLQRRIIHREDRRFGRHPGIDPIALARALWNNRHRPQSIQGASTLHTQILKNHDRLHTNHKKRTRLTKIMEFARAPRLALWYSKEELITMWANTVPFGNGIIGFERAARHFFSQPVDKINAHQRFALFVMARNPRIYHPFTNPDRFHTRFDRMWRECIKKDLCEDENVYTTYGPRIVPTNITNSLSSGIKIHFKPLTPPHRAGYITNTLTTRPSQRLDTNKKTNGLTNQHTSTHYIRTTIDTQLSDAIFSRMRQVVASYHHRRVSDAAVIVIDHRKHEVKALLGGIDFWSETGGQVNAVFARNQPGSALKPFVYLGAVLQGRSLDSTILDIRRSYQTAEGLPYEPHNIDLEEWGAMTLAHALATSRNTPAVEITNRVGLTTIDALFRHLKLNLTQPKEHYGLALSLGAPDIRLWDLVHSYGIFVHHGLRCSSALIQGDVTRCEPKVSKNASKIIDNVLRSRALRRATFPLYGNLDYPDGRVGLKTGTSRNFSDNWLIIRTDHYLIGIWVGNKNGSPMHEVTGSMGAGEIGQHIIALLEPEIESQRLSIEPLPSFSRSVGFEYPHITNREISSPLPGPYKLLPGQTSISLPLHAFVPEGEEFWWEIHIDQTQKRYGGEQKSLYLKPGTVKIHLIDKTGTIHASRSLTILPAH